MIQYVIHLVSVWAIPLLLVGIPLYGLLRGVKVYECFVEGAKEGFQVAVRIIPYLVAILVAVGMLRAPYDNILDTIGWTPLIRLTRVTKGIITPVYGKAEFFNRGVR